jgi:hypothetical protein
MPLAANRCTHIPGRLRLETILNLIRKSSSPTIAYNFRMRGTSSPCRVEDAGAVCQDYNAAGESAQTERL